MFAELLRSKLAGIAELSDSQVTCLHRHYELLTRWNRVVNLTSVRSIEEAVERHYCESVFAGIHLPAGQLSIADIGSGAGFPGIPIAVVRSDCTVALIESHQRKAAFLKEAAREFPNIRVLSQRAEDVQDHFDWVVSRAVRYTEISSDLKRLGQYAELLTGEVRPGDLDGFNWRESIHLPWGERRYLLIGVSRGTGS